MGAKDTVIDDKHYLIRDALKRYDESLEPGCFWRLLRDVKEAQAESTWDKAIREVLEFIRDWETLSLSEFDAKYGVHKDALGSAKGLRDYIAIHFKVGSSKL